MIFNLNSLVLSIFILLLGATNNLHVVHSASQLLRGRTYSNSNNQDRMMIMDRSQLQTQILTDLRKMQQQQQQQQQTEGPSDSPINSETSDEDNNHIDRWPNLVDLTGDQAKLKLEEDYGVDTYNIIVLRYGSLVTRDISYNRIRIYVDEGNIVVKVPVIG